MHYITWYNYDQNFVNRVWKQQAMFKVFWHLQIYFPMGHGRHFPIEFLHNWNMQIFPSCGMFAHNHLTMRQPIGRMSVTWQCGARTTTSPSMSARQRSTTWNGNPSTPPIESFKFLCVHNTKECSWSTHITVMKKAQQCLFPLRKLKRFSIVHSDPQKCLQLQHWEHLDWLHHCLVWPLLGIRPQGASEGSAYVPVHHWGWAPCHTFCRCSQVQWNAYVSCFNSAVIPNNTKQYTQIPKTKKYQNQQCLSP
jgi:hypothetical protein